MTRKPKVLKPMVKSSVVKRPYLKSVNAESAKPVYVPTHFRKRAPKLPIFKGELEKFGLRSVREQVQFELIYALQNAYIFPDFDGNSNGTMAMYYRTGLKKEYFINTLPIASGLKPKPHASGLRPKSTVKGLIPK